MKSSLPGRRWSLVHSLPMQLMAALLPLLAPACDRLDPDIRIRRKDTLIRQEGGRPPGRADSAATVEIPPDGLFVTAVAYPDGYDWRRDTARGNVIGRLLLLRLQDTAGAPSSPAPAVFDTILSLAAGAGRAVSLDPDRHQFCGGHLFTQCLTEAGTVWKRDGQTFLISREQEYVRGILALDSTLYTLSQRLNGSGFLFRRNGKLLLQRDGGRIQGSPGDWHFGAAGALSPDSGQEEQAVAVPEKLASLYDLRCYEGTQHFVGKGTDGREPILYAGDQRLDLSVLMGTPVELSGLRLYRSDKGVSVIGNFLITRTGRQYTARWQGGRLLDVGEGRRDWLEGGAWLQRENGRIVSAHHDGTDYPLDGNVTLMMPACACVTPDALWLGLTVYGATPMLWVNGTALSVDINGFLTSVTLLEP